MCVCANMLTIANMSAYMYIYIHVHANVYMFCGKATAGHCICRADATGASVAFYD